MRDGKDGVEASGLSVSLTVRDLEVSRAWYCDVAGFAVERTYEREGKVMAIALESGGVRLLITQDDGSRGWDRVKGEGFSMQLTTNQDIDALASGIAARGGSITTGPLDMPWGARMFRIQDPDGFRFTISTVVPR